jgi:hypothetical protein
MWVLLVLSISGGAGSKTAVSQHATSSQCQEALKLVRPADYPGHFLTTCLFTRVP